MQNALASEISYQHFLLSEFESRKSRNAGYSLRAFARDLDVAAPKLSEILRGKCGLSEASALRISGKIGLSLTETQLFVDLVNAKHSRSKVLKQKAQEKLKSSTAYASYSELSLDTFKIISDWSHFAILELTEVENFKSNHKWIAKKLDLPLAHVESAVERLLDFGLLENVAGKWVQTQKSLSTPSGVPSSEIKKYHRQILSKAEKSLTEDEISTRDFSAMTMAIPEDAFAEIQNEIKMFRRMISNKYLKKDKKTRVYSLAIQLFPLDKKGEEV